MFLGCLGNDVYADKVVENLRADGIDVSRVITESDIASGSALIMVNQNGENYLTVAPGSNYCLTPARIRENEDLIQDAAMVLLQMEIPIDTVNEVLKLSGKYGISVLFNYAPVRNLEVKVGPAMTILAVNEVEAAALSGNEVSNSAEALVAAENLRERGPAVVIVTLGADGVVIVSDEKSEIVPAFKVTPADTTAAGDTFSGAFAVARVEGRSLRDSVRFANAAAGISVTRMGAQPSIPKRGEIDAWLAEPA